MALDNLYTKRGFMKRVFFVRFIFSILVFILFNSLVSCASVYRPLSKTPNAKVIASISTEFNFDGRTDIGEREKHAAYIHLLETASARYQGNIDVVDITVSYQKLGPRYDFTYIADGKVVLLDDKDVSALGGSVEGALAKAAEQTLKNVPKKSRIAIVYLTALDKNTTEFVAGELEFLWVNSGFIIVDRSQLDRIRREQNFQMSGEVDDETAVSIGKFIGADVIVTGRVDGEGNLRRLRLRALNTQTAQVVGAASERI